MTPDIEAQILALHAAGAPVAQICQRVARGKSVVYDAIRRAKLAAPDHAPADTPIASPLDAPFVPYLPSLPDPPIPVSLPVRIPVGHAPPATDWPRLTGDYLVLSDLHVPFHDAAMIETALADARRIGIERFIIAGDFLDIFQFSKHAANLSWTPRLQDDIVCAAEVLAALVGAMPGGGVVLMGNHDARIERMVRGQMDPQWILPRLYQADARVTFSRYEQCELLSGGRRWRILHGANYSGASPLGVAKRLSAKFGASIAMGHQHHTEEGFDVSGGHQCICMGGVHDPAKLAYVHVSPRTNPAQTRSYLLIKDGYGLHIADGLPDWARELM